MVQGLDGLKVYQKSFSLAMKIYEESKLFPKEERYSLTDQVRRSSRAVSVCLAKAYRKRRYQSYFVSKLTDADMENTETQVWLRYSLECKYISQETYIALISDSSEIGSMIEHMINHPEKFVIIA